MAAKGSPQDLILSEHSVTSTLFLWPASQSVKMTSSDIGMVVQKDPMVRNLDEKFTFQNCYDQRLSTRVAIKQQAVDDALKHIEAIVRKFRVGIAGVHEQERDAFNMMGGSEVSGWLEEIGAYFSTSHEASSWVRSHRSIGR